MQKIDKLPLKYLGYSIVMQEVPDEISLGFNVSGCPHHCHGCHSKFLWEYEGNYLSEDLLPLLKKYKDYITCVCMFGGEQNPTELQKHCDTIHNYGLRVCLYTGVETLDLLPQTILQSMDYIKTGAYKEEFGALNEKTTNQRMYKKQDGVFVDITYRFWRSYENN